jgi:hypothetical protein
MFVWYSRGPSRKEKHTMAEQKPLTVQKYGTIYRLGEDGKYRSSTGKVLVAELPPQGSHSGSTRLSVFERSAGRGNASRGATSNYI